MRLEGDNGGDVDNQFPKQAQVNTETDGDAIIV
jgi:hypothetical protein